jgi:hypothetical protein
MQSNLNLESPRAICACTHRPSIAAYFKIQLYCYYQCYIYKKKSMRMHAYELVRIRIRARTRACTCGRGGLVATIRARTNRYQYDK